ncbi:antitoxin Xre/MbcA/ParS toxin-binding domain-containing protein [Pseudomonas sp. NPDC089752]|uniref:antitoxin Xre/MbcA/ParS toxin-binding domain-containing protein n=1 Tax=Pseudomonas sp. NPDC089752 TaxID=3364472 RepID=UPI0038176C60
MSNPRIVAPCTCSRIGGWSSEHRCFLARYEQILSVADAVFGDRQLAQRWLGKPAVGLANLTPCRRLSTPKGYEDVHEVLMRIDHGICI